MKVAVLGSGSWGTALSKVLVDNGHETMLWGIEAEVIQEINDHHTNHKYLKEAQLPAKLKASLSLEECCQTAELILLVLPTKAIRSVCDQLTPILSSMNHPPLIVHATKGIELETELRISQVIEACLSADAYQDIVVLSGPSHAEEVAVEDLTTITAASKNPEAARRVQEVFMNDYFRVYTNRDIVGVELGGALKNIIALAAGILAGLGYGDNAKAALITRGLAEMTRLGVKLGADPLTFSGLSGVGDLIVTCTSVHSRNWQAGKLFAQGYNLDQVVDRVQMIVEGITTTQVAYQLAREYQVEMPITQAVYQLVYQDAPLREGIVNLMTREGKSLSLIHI